MTQRRDPRVPASIKIRYEKSNLNRVIHASGIWGGLTPDGNVMMALFTERSDFPEPATYKVSPTGRLQEPPTPAAALVREIEVEAVMSLATAQALIVWLQDKIKQAESVAAFRAELAERNQPATESATTNTSTETA